jgi:hypothetical protein
MTSELEAEKTKEMHSKEEITHHMHCMSWRLLCWSPSFVNKTAVFSAIPTFRSCKEELNVKASKSKKNQEASALSFEIKYMLY